MERGRRLRGGAESTIGAGDALLALSKMLEAAELAARLGTKTEAVEQLRELQAHCEKMIGILAPEEKTRPKLVAA
jgi:hypothetical protein